MPKNIKGVDNCIYDDDIVILFTFYLIQIILCLVILVYELQNGRALQVLYPTQGEEQEEYMAQLPRGPFQILLQLRPNILFSDNHLGAFQISDFKLI